MEPVRTTVFSVAEIDHVVLRCRDQARTLAFYQRVLGLHEERRLESISLIQLRAGRSLIDLVPAGSEQEWAAGNVEHVCLGVEATDFDAVIDYLREQGVEMVGEPAVRYGAHGNGLSVYIRDPERNVIELKLMPRPA